MRRYAIVLSCAFLTGTAGLAGCGGGGGTPGTAPPSVVTEISASPEASPATSAAA